MHRKSVVFQAHRSFNVSLQCTYLYPAKPNIGIVTGMLSIAVHKFRKLHFDCFDGTTGEAVSGATVSFMQWTLAQGIPVIQACIDELKKLHALRYAMSVLHDKLPPWIIREMNPIGVEIMTRLGRLMEHACFGDWTA